MSFKIGIVGPTKVGKTSLITAIFEQGKDALKGSRALLRLRGQGKGLIEKHQQQLEQAIAHGEFDAGSLENTEETTTYNLELALGQTSLHFELMDYPGGLLSEQTRTTGLEADWERCLESIKASSVLLVPIDAAVIMEATLPSERQAVPSILRTTAVKEVMYEWSKRRSEAWAERREPALLVLAPIKCETYLDDNGGRSDKADLMQRSIREFYRKPLESVVDEAPHVSILYAPVDTYGCVELKHATFAPTFKARYRFRDLRPTIQPKGADTILGVICAQMLEALAGEQQRKEEYLDKDRRKKEEDARSSGFWRSIEWWFTGEGDKRDKARDQANDEHQKQRVVVATLNDAVGVLARHKPSGRSRWIRRDEIAQ